MIKIELPQLILTSLMLINIGISLSKFGQKKEGTYGLAECLIGPAIAFSLLWWGGFYG